MAQLNDLIVTGNSRFINKTYTSTADVDCITASSAAGATEHSAGTTGQALVSDGDSVYWGDPQHADTTDEAQHATSAATLDDTEFIEDNEPYLFRPASREIGDRVYEDAIVGGSVAWNQVAPTAKASWGPVAVTITGDSNEWTITSNTDNVALKAMVINFPINHVAFCSAYLKNNTENDNIYAMVGLHKGGGLMAGRSRTNSNSYTLCQAIAKIPSDATANQFVIRISNDAPQGTSISAKEVMCIDLTLMFGSTIADYIYTLEQSEAGSGIAWLKSQGFFTKDYYEYNAGGIQSVKTSAKKVVGFNQWDEQWEVGTFDNDTGEKAPFTNYWRSKNPIKILPNTVYYAFTSGDSIYRFYYDKDGNFIGTQIGIINTTFTTPNNAYYLNIVDVTRNAYDNETKSICINFSDPNRNGEYEPYKEQEYTLGNDELRGLFKLDTTTNKLYTDGDIKTSDGVIKRKYGIVDLGTLTWGIDGQRTGLFKADLTSAKSNTGIGNMPNILCGRYMTIAAQSLSTWRNDTRNAIISLGYDTARIYIIDTAYSDAETFKAAMSGQYLIYELATPTTETSTPFTNPQVVYADGTEEFVDERAVAIPVGHNSRYPKTDNYKLANIPAPPGGAGDYIVHTDEYGESVYQQASDIKVNYAGTADLGKRRIFIQGTQTTGTTTGLWTGDASEYFQSSADLTDGQEITYWLPLPTTGSATLNLKFGDGTSSGAVNCYYGGTTRLTTHYGQGQAIHLTYRKNVKIPSTGSTTYTGWWADANYYSDSNTVSSLRGDYTYLVAGTNVGVQSNSLIARDANGKYSSFTSNSTTAVSKVANRTDYFDISKIFYYNSSAAAGGNMASASLYWAMANINSRYTINASTLTARKPLYLKFDANESTVSSITGAVCYKLGGTANDDYWSQTLPTSADGMIYVEVSRGVRDYRVDLAEDQHFYQFTDRLHEYDSWNVGYATSATDAITAKYSDGAIVFEEDAEDDTGDGTIALLYFNNTGTRVWNTPGTSSSLIYMSDKYSPCIRRYKDGKMLYVDSGVVDISLMQDITLIPNRIVYMNLQGFNTFTTIAAAWSIAGSPFTQTAIADDQMIMGIAIDSTHFYLFPENKFKDKLGHSGHAYGMYSYMAECLDVDSQIGGGTSAVYFTSAGKPAAIDIKAVTVNNATNASKVNGIAFGALSTVSTITSGMLPSHTHTTADVTSFNSAVDARITRDAILSKISSSGVYTGDYSVAEGYKTTASGKYSHAEGDRTTATTTAAHAEGCLTTAAGQYAHAEGYYTKASAVAAHAEGYIAYATGNYAHAEGKDTLANAETAHVEGELSTASGLTSHAEGYHCLASGEGAHAGGSYSTASGDVSYAKGMYLNANVDYQRVVGTYNSTVDNALLIVGSGTGIGARKNALYITTADNIAIGSGHVIDTTNSITAGTNCYVTTVTGIATTGANSFAFGNACTAVGDCSWAEGNETRANQTAHAEGDSTLATGESSHAEGYNVLASGDASHAEGSRTTASGLCSHAEGYLTFASTSYTHAEGRQTSASGNHSHAEGYQTTAGGGSSHTEGYKTYTSTVAGHAEGYATNASGSTAAHAEGRMTLASGTVSHAEGNLTTASESASHAEGNQTLASGGYSHAEGNQTTASGSYSHAEGSDTLASSPYSHAGGYYTIANKGAQTAIGKYNATAASALFIVGNGSSSADTGIVRTNAMYVTTAGNVNCVTVTQASDERLKENIQPLTTADKSILDVLEPKQFTLKADERHQLHYGFIAQDVERQINALGFPTSSHSLIDIADNEEAYYSLNYTELIPLLVQRVKDLEQRVAELEQR